VLVDPVRAARCARAGERRQFFGKRSSTFTRSSSRKRTSWSSTSSICWGRNVWSSLHAGPRGAISAGHRALRLGAGGSQSGCVVFQIGTGCARLRPDHAGGLRYLRRRRSIARLAQCHGVPRSGDAVRCGVRAYVIGAPRFRIAFASGQAEIAHLKMTYSPDEALAGRDRGRESCAQRFRAGAFTQAARAVETRTAHHQPSCGECPGSARAKRSAIRCMPCRNPHRRSSRSFIISNISGRDVPRRRIAINCRRVRICSGGTGKISGGHRPEH